MYANDGYRELDPRECLSLLATVPVGRVVYTRHALPAVLPLNFRLDADGAVLLRVSATSDLAGAVDGTVVAFEGDMVDAEEQSGWSVVVTGPAAVVRDPAAHARLVRTGPRSWAPAPQEVFVRIEPELVTGRMLVPGRTMYGLDLPT
ncbi:pyridoxamine 5'-phosphate oxidase family protein [Streptomyces sp. NPDC048663]|uniref:pyridoxamine 5'-phosphate oxidase family protein n=1 Tax=Streptomyces sp. NPDC048663 TaxID=3155638 RepID=UPI00341AC9F4